MTTTIDLGEIGVDVVWKDIKNVHLSVHPPTGRVRIAAPKQMNLEAIRLFAISKMAWIKRHRTKLENQQREPPREFLELESHYVWGKRYLLSIHEQDGSSSIELDHKRMHLIVRPNVDRQKMASLVDAWYRGEVRQAAAEFIPRWERNLDVKVNRVHVQRMKTKWGSSNPMAKAIRLNTELAKKPRECMEYIVLHEMAHFLQPTHNDRFQSILNCHMPDWKHRRQVLNRLPLTP